MNGEEPSRGAGSEPYSSLDVGISDRLPALTAWCYVGGFIPGQSLTNMQEILDSDDTLAEENQGEGNPKYSNHVLSQISAVDKFQI